MDELSSEAGVSERRRRIALVVDDEPLVGRMIAALLGRDGWQTVLALEAETALLVASGRRIDLLVTDYEIPGMSGLALAARVRDHDPDVPILVVSGSPDARGLVEGPRVAFVAKPFQPDELMETVRALAS